MAPKEEKKSLPPSRRDEERPQSSRRTAPSAIAPPGFIMPPPPVLPARPITGYDLDQEQIRREEEHTLAYVAHVKASERRRMKFEDMKTRTKIWNEREKAIGARLTALDREKQDLEAEMVQMRKGREEYMAKHGQEAYDGEKDEEIKKKYEDYFELKTDSLDVE